MRTTLLFAACCAGLALCAQDSAAYADSTLQRAIDARASKATFSVQHVFVERVAGSVPILSGSVTLPPGSAIPLGASAVLDATKVDTGDSDRDSSLESSDFFDVRRFPMWTFRSTRVMPQGVDTFGMDGVLTVHGVAQLEHLDVTVHGDAPHVSYHAIAHIDRHAFGMSVTRLDPAIGGTVDVVLDLTLK